MVGEVALRLLTAVLAAGAIGFNREMRRKPAGLRTHALVGLGSALAVLVVAPLAPNIPPTDAMSRVIQGVLAGVGFLGGGAILKSTSSPLESVSGLTTAASIWLVAALGIACGAGQWVAALIAVVIALTVLIIGGPFERLLHRLFEAKKAPQG